MNGWSYDRSLCCFTFILIGHISGNISHHSCRKYALSFFFILFLNFTILYWFCQISKWIHHRYTCVPHPEPSSLLPPHTIPLCRPSAPVPSIWKYALSTVAIMDWLWYKISLEKSKNSIRISWLSRIYNKICKYLPHILYVREIYSEYICVYLCVYCFLQRDVN